MAARAPRSSSSPAPKPAAKAATPANLEEEVVEPATTATAAAAPSPSVLERLRRNRMGAVLGGLVMSMAVALLLSIFVPDSNVLLALVVLGLAESFAVGFTVRYLTASRGWPTQLTAFVLAAMGVHVLVTAGMVNQAIGGLGSVVERLLSQGGGAASGLGWDDAVITALGTPFISTGAVVCGLVAAIVAGWGLRTADGRFGTADDA